MRRYPIERRDLLRHACCGAAGLTFGMGMSYAFAADGKQTDLTPDQALALLKRGNEHFLANKPLLMEQNKKRQLEIAQVRAPIAVLVGCSDSPVSPEILFRRGLGELFVILNAGNTIGRAAQGSIEYAVGKLGVPLIVVLGHERCGAIAAALEVVEKNAAFPGWIDEMVEPIVPAVLKAKRMTGEAAGHDELLDAAVRENARRLADSLGLSEMLTEHQRTGRLKIVGARCDLNDGRVEFFHEA